MTIAPRWQTLWHQHGPFGGTLARIFGPRIWHRRRTPLAQLSTFTLCIACHLWFSQTTLPVHLDLSLPFTSEYIIQCGLCDKVVFTAEPVVFVLSDEAGVVTTVSCATMIDHRVQRISVVEGKRYTRLVYFCSATALNSSTGIAGSCTDSTNALLTCFHLKDKRQTPWQLAHCSHCCGCVMRT